MEQGTGTGKYEKLLMRCKGLEPVPTAVAHPCEVSALTGAIDAAQLGLILPVLVGPSATIASTAERPGIAIGKFKIIDAPHSHGAAQKAVELLREGKVELLMKGSLHTDALMGVVVAREGGL